MRDDCIVQEDGQVDQVRVAWMKLVQEGGIVMRRSAVIEEV